MSRPKCPRLKFIFVSLCSTLFYLLAVLALPLLVAVVSATRGALLAVEALLVGEDVGSVIIVHRV